MNKTRLPEIIDRCSVSEINVAKMVRRMVRFAPRESLVGLERIVITDYDPKDMGFGCYWKQERQIDIFARESLDCLPWALKKMYIFPYLFIGQVFGHELDHHINRDNDSIDKELSAEQDSLVYIYPSFGIFKLPAKILRRFLLAAGWGR
ncbi:hypothetical protein Dalk_2349 [Desulfatibacillum aliphaticivorans]|uniref:Uncharacterized protein n=1 Tax=Desulfatibacillum aliphaticivorans TaxID=218208 RepID=B8FAV6_DESAL|nr:hypothetical protein [Desulfatibacillum aliphaticivorans]ACL04042.1 hypothetical protein Dalk_2349 [Desulfatibacillum aliphaticivorans]